MDLLGKGTTWRFFGAGSSMQTKVGAVLRHPSHSQPRSSAAHFRHLAWDSDSLKLFWCPPCCRDRQGVLLRKPGTRFENFARNGSKVTLRTCAVCVMHNLVRRVLCRGTLPFAANVSCPCSAADSRIHDISSQGYKNGEDLDTVANNLGRPAQSLPLSKHIGHRQASIRRRS